MVPQTSAPPEISMLSGEDLSGQTISGRNFSTDALWRPNFSGANIAVGEYDFLGAHLPGADFRGTNATEIVPGLPAYMLSEARGAIVDDHFMHDSTQGETYWVLSAPEDTPENPDAEEVVRHGVPFIQWSFSDSQWERLLHEGYDPDELVDAAQEFPPGNDAGFRMFMDGASTQRIEVAAPHSQAWGGRRLMVPPMSNARRRHEAKMRSWRKQHPSKL